MRLAYAVGLVRNMRLARFENDRLGIVELGEFEVRAARIGTTGFVQQEE